MTVPALGAFLLAAAALAGCSEDTAETKEIIRPVKVLEIAKADDTRALEYSGYVRARTEMNLGFRVNGKVIARLVDIGERVKPDDVLARVDSTDYGLAVNSAEANLAAAQKQVETTDLARTRAEQLYAKNVAPKSQLEEATLASEQAVSTRDAAISSLQQARNQVGYTELKSDKSGIVTAIAADVGQVVSAGTPVLAVAVDGEKEVQIAVPETDIAQFSPGKMVKVRFWSHDALLLDGKVREVAGSADQQSRTFAVRVSLPEDPRILLGMTATIEATGDNGGGFVSVPLSALAEKNGEQIVWLVDRGAGTVHARVIKISDFTGDGVHVAEGLRQGDLVVAAGTQFMAENMKVKLPGSGQQSASVEGTADGELVR
ncbi:efflux RND transporter periplasmic adaptor subunit [Rhizobium sp. BK251]|uniref:efflux RND transporter periplasmic adaptor subunit n=1 Tax=Rhizobium sp. BK251 TaxID=2512125 RepID=UPI001FE21BAD|nr:efflux RND transporter periplasmic adaptor subunit [Rhizobium sp. BK251]